MASVTQRIKEIKQPWGGFLNPRALIAAPISDTFTLDAATDENVPPVLVGLTVDYLTRFYQGATAATAFRVSLAGYEVFKKRMQARGIHLPLPTDPRQIFPKLKPSLDDETIRLACNLVKYDVYFRAAADVDREPEEIRPSATSIENIRKMVQLSDAFRQKYGPFVLDGFELTGGYTRFITTGDGDFTTRDTLWDMKVSKYPPTKEHTLQLMIYYLMGLHSEHATTFQAIKFLGIYNPRLNMTYTIAVDKIPEQTWETVSHTVIGY